MCMYAPELLPLNLTKDQKVALDRLPGTTGPLGNTVLIEAPPKPRTILGGQ